MRKIRSIALGTLALAALLGVSARAQQPGAIKGKVKEQGGKALADVVVRAVNAADKNDQRETKTDSKGEFELSGLPAGSYALAFERQGFRAFTTRPLEVAAGETVKLSRTIELRRESAPFAVVRGAVFYGVGYSLPNAAVTIERIDGGKRFKQEKVSQEGGEFSFRLPAEKATYRITASARGFQSASKEISVEGDEVQHVALSLQPAK